MSANVTVSKMVERINELKEIIDAKKSDADKIQGRIDQSLEQLKKQFNVTSLEAAKQIMEDKAKLREAINKKITLNYEALTEYYEW